jgi:hypothetical protein
MSRSITAPSNLFPPGDPHGNAEYMTQERDVAQISSRASVSTDRAARYGKQLSSHLGHKRRTTWQEEAKTGDIAFPRGRATLFATPTQLEMVIELDASVPTADAAAELAYMEDVVGRHLARFGARHELIVSWVRSDGSVGQVYGEADQEQAD